MRLIFLISTSIAGGAQIYLFNMVNYLKKDYSVLVLCPNGFLSEKLKTIEGIEVGLTKIGFMTVSYLRSLFKKEIQNYETIYVNAHLLGTALWTAMALNGLRGVRFTMTAHNQVTNESSSIYKKMIYPILYNYISKKVNSFIAVSEDIAISITNITGKECKYIRTSVPLSQDPISTKKKNEFNSKLTIGFVGRLSSLKNPIRFVDTAKMIKAKLPLSNFVIIGEGELRENVENEIERCGLKDSFDMLGFVDKPLQEMAKFDVMMITSDSEGTPLALLEAMSIGLPIVSTKVGGIPKLIKDGVNGLLANTSPESLTESLLKLVNDEELYLKISTNSRKLIEKEYSYEKNITKYLYIVLGM